MNTTRIKNKRAYFDYHIIDEQIAGIVLKGSEIKSIRLGKISLSGSYCFINNNEIFVKGMDITINDKSNYKLNHDPTRDKKLLMNKKEIIELFESVSQKGLTIMPLEVFINDSGLIKLKIGLGKGKKNYDKRESKKAKDLDRDMQRS